MSLFYCKRKDIRSMDAFAGSGFLILTSGNDAAAVTNRKAAASVIGYRLESGIITLAAYNRKTSGQRPDPLCVLFTDDRQDSVLFRHIKDRSFSRFLMAFYRFDERRRPPDIRICLFLWIRLVCIKSEKSVTDY